MVNFEVYRNGKKLCTAGVGQYGVLTACLAYVSHNPKKLARWKAVGRSIESSDELYLHVGGIEGDERTPKHVNWGNIPIESGDEVLLRVSDGSSRTRPRGQTSYRASLKRMEADERRYLRETAKRLGWKIDENPKGNRKPRKKSEKKKELDD